MNEKSKNVKKKARNKSDIGKEIVKSSEKKKGRRTVISRERRKCKRGTRNKKNEGSRREKVHDGRASFETTLCGKSEHSPSVQRPKGRRWMASP